MTRTSLLTSLIIPIFLVVLAVIQLAVGGNSLPGWISTISIKMEIDPLSLLRVLIMGELILALFCSTLGRGAVTAAWIALASTGFVSLAECAASLNRTTTAELVSSAAVLAISIGLAIALSTATRGDVRSEAVKSRSSKPRGRHPMLVMVMALIILSVVLNISISPRTVAEGRPLTVDGPEVAGDVAIFTLPAETWIDRPVTDIELAAYMPELPPLTAEGRSIVVIYNKGCGDCHDLFEVHFGEGFHLPVIAIEVPPAEGAVLSESIRTDDVKCMDCVMSSLPAGPLWLIKTPVVMVVEDGRVVCLESVDHLRCIDEA
jgi:hypothetical protein